MRCSGTLDDAQGVADGGGEKRKRVRAIFGEESLTHLCDITRNATNVQHLYVCMCVCVCEKVCVHAGVGVCFHAHLTKHS